MPLKTKSNSKYWMSTSTIQEYLASYNGAFPHVSEGIYIIRKIERVVREDYEEISASLYCHGVY